MPVLLFSAVAALLLLPAAGVDRAAAPFGQDAPRILLDQSPRAVEYQLNRLTNDELVRVERRTDDVRYRPIYFALLTRKGVAQAVRNEGLAALVTMDKASPSAILIGALSRIPADDAQTGDALLEMLFKPPSAALRVDREAFEKVATEGNSPLVLAGAYGAMMIADGDPAAAWQAGVKRGHAAALLRAVPRLPASGALRGRVVQPVLGLLDESKDPAVRAAAVAALASARPDAVTFERLAQEVLGPPNGMDPAARDAAISALKRIPESAWPRARGEPLARAIVALVKAAPAEKRTDPSVIEAIQLGDKLAALLPEEARRSVRRDLRALGVQVVAIATVPEQMLFDLKWFVVEAAKPVQIVLTNADAMSHNLVMGAPRSVQEIGTAASTMPPPADPDAKAYIPDSPLVLHATRLLQGGETDRLNFTAPEKPGEYVFVCTFPGHWIRMYGVMLVVPDMDAWEARPTRPTDPITGKLLRLRMPRHRPAGCSSRNFAHSRHTSKVVQPSEPFTNAVPTGENLAHFFQLRSDGSLIFPMLAARSRSPLRGDFAPPLACGRRRCSLRSRGHAGIYSRRRRISRNADFVFHEATPSGFESSISSLMSILLPLRSWVMIWRSSSHTSILAGVTRMRALYQRPFWNSMDCDVSFSDASWPLMLDSPTTEPPQPPRMSEQNESSTGKVTPAKKSRPSTRIACRAIS
jgi:azurin/DNA-binding transcriptional ArsR family regulator